MKVLNSNVLIKVKDETEKVSGLTIKVGNGEYEVAEVLAVGEKVENVEVGNTVYIYVGSGKKFHHESSEYRVVNSSEIIVVL